MAVIQHFTVSQIRVAATCPRILYFDLLETQKRRLRYPRVSRIWKSGDEAVACGRLFHSAVEAFNSTVARSGQAAKLLAGITQGTAQIEQEFRRLIYRDFVDRKKLYRAPGESQQAFMRALDIYVNELAAIVSYALSSNVKQDSIIEHLFGDRRRRVDVTFDVGQDGQSVHVTGQLDYVFYDWRSARRRIIDYKLTPGEDPSNDLFQVSMYGLMHHAQHNTEPDVAVFYLHPQRRMYERSWSEINERRYRMYDLLASMIEWTEYGASKVHGLKPPGEPIHCAHCRYKARCVKDLGAKNEGQRVTIWESRLKGKPAAADEPHIVRNEPSPPSDHTEADCAGAVRPSQIGETFAVDNLWLGQLHAQPERRVAMPSSLLPTHTAVVGAAGSGKTWLAKGIAEEAILQGIPVLVIDPQGDLVQFLRRSEIDHLPHWVQDRYERYWRTVEPLVFTPGSSHAVRISLNPLRLPRNDQFASIADPMRRKEEFEGMLGATAENLIGLAQSRGELGAQRAFLLKLLMALSRNGENGEISLPDIIAAIRAPESVGIDEPNDYIRKPDREKLGRSLLSLFEGPTGQLFRDGLPLDIDSLRRPATAGKVPLNVIYLNALSDDSQKQFFVASLATEIYRWMITCGNGPAMRLLFYIDEAQDFLPMGSKNVPAKQPLIRLFTQGRKYGVGCLICTQSPRSVDYNVFGNCSSKIVGRLAAAQDVERVAQWFKDVGGAPEWLAGRKSAEKGCFVGKWPANEVAADGMPFISRPLFSLHEGAWSPDRVERELANDQVKDSLRSNRAP